MELDNLSRFGATSQPAYSREGADLHVVYVAARFDFPAKLGDTPQPSEEQPEPQLEDVHWAEPETSSLKIEGQGAYTRLGSDIYVCGQAWAPGGTPVTMLPVSVRVGSLHHQAIVFGDRLWRGGAGEPRPDAPRPFTSMPLQYERAFGGTVEGGGLRKPLHEPRNPVGCGLYRGTTEAMGQPLPNIEDPRRPITRLGDRPTPVGFGPIARQWASRLAYAGTYDDVWVETRAPYWPKDLDMRFFNAASPGMALDQRLPGGAEVVLDGLSPHGRVAFPLPAPRLLLKSYFGDYEEMELLEADSLQIDPDDAAFTLYYRCAIARGKRRDAYLASVLREVYDWEDIGL